MIYRGMFWFAWFVIIITLACLVFDFLIKWLLVFGVVCFIVSISKLLLEDDGQLY